MEKRQMWRLGKNVRSGKIEKKFDFSCPFHCMKSIQERKESLATENLGRKTFVTFKVLIWKGKVYNSEVYAYACM